MHRARSVHGPTPAPGVTEHALNGTSRLFTQVWTVNPPIRGSACCSAVPAASRPPHAVLIAACASPLVLDPARIGSVRAVVPPVVEAVGSPAVVVVERPGTCIIFDEEAGIASMPVAVAMVSPIVRAMMRSVSGMGSRALRCRGRWAKPGDNRSSAKQDQNTHRLPPSRPTVPRRITPESGIVHQ